MIRILKQNYGKHSNILLEKSCFFPWKKHLISYCFGGALKLKEISYIHAEGYAGGELKHGPLALVEEGTPIIVIASEGSSHKKLLGNAREVASRGAKVIFITHQEDDLADSHADLVIKVPRTHDLLQPLLYNIICQLLSLNIAEERDVM